MVLLSRHHALVADLGACAETLSGTQASARVLIALPDDIFNTDAATIHRRQHTVSCGGHDV